MKRMLFVVLLLPVTVLLPDTAIAQDGAGVRRLFEAGQYQQVIESADGAGSPEALYAAAQSHQKLGAANEARETYGRLAARPEGDVWHFIGLSGQALLDDQTDAANEAARRATAMAGTLSDTHYQFGLVLAKREDWLGAAGAFDRAAELSPGYAYAHYYGWADALSRQPAGSHGGSLRAVLETRARGAGTARSPADHADSARTVRRGGRSAETGPSVCVRLAYRSRAQPELDDVKATRRYVRASSEGSIRPGRIALSFCG